MVTLLLRKMLRDFKGAASTYLVCLSIIVMGFTGYCVLSILSAQLTQAKDVFYEQTAFAQIWAEVHDAPLSVTRRLEEIPGVQTAQGRIVKTVRLAGFEKNPPELRLFSYEADGLNVPLLSSGGAPSPGEMSMVLGDAFFVAREYALGDTIPLIISGREMPLTVSASGFSPESVYMVKSMVDMLPNPLQYDAAFLPYETMAKLFSLSGRCNDLILTLQPGYALEDVKEEIENVLSPYGCYRVFDRSEELSASVLDMELTQLGRMANVLPFLFLSISAVVLYISFSRLIQQQRTQIGTLMALGVTPRMLSLHYTLYGTTLGVVGGVLGGVFGNLAAGPMAAYYRTYFKLPETPVEPSFRYVFLGALMAGVFCSLVCCLASYRASRLDPAAAMRPAPPKTAKKSFIEAIPALAKLFTVSGLMAIRNLSRNKRKAALSLFGIACAYMITTSLVSMSSLFDVYIYDYLEKNQQQDFTLSFQAPVARADALSAVSDPRITRAEGIIEAPATLSGGGTELSCLLQGIETDSTLCKLYAPSGAAVRVQEEGIVLSTHMANQLGVSKGDLLEVTITYPKSNSVWVPVTDIMAQYLGSTAYLSYQGLGKISPYRDCFTGVLLSGPPELQKDLADRLSEAGNVAGVKSRSEVIDSYRGMMGSVTGIMFAMSFMGILVGTAVIYISSVISYEEQKREIATMLMLGMKTGACLEVISVGQWVITVGSLALGIPMTYGVSYLLTTAMTGKLFSIPPYISLSSLCIGALLTFLSVLLSSGVMFRKLRKLSPIDLMGTRE